MGRRSWPLWAALVGLIVGAVVAFGAVSDGLPRAEQTPAPTSVPPSATPRRGSDQARALVVLSVDLTTAGTVWLTTAGTACGGCVVVWRRGPDDDAWTPLRQVGSEHRPGQIRMADSGVDGLVGGAGLWVTRDGGDNWVHELDVPVEAGDRVQVEVTASAAWALVRGSGREPVLWRSPFAAPGWRVVPAPPALDPDAAPTAVDDGLLVWVTGHRGPEPVVSEDAGRSWEPLEPPCAQAGGQVGGQAGGQVGTTAAYATCSTQHGLELAVRTRDTWEGWSLTAALGPPRFLSPVAGADSIATAPGGIGYAVVRGNLLATRDHGRTWTRLSDVE